MNLLKVIQKQANEYPTRPAFVNRDQIITFEQLWCQSDNLASSIINKGLKKKSPIVVYGHMDPGMLVAFLGCVKAGHPYVPVDVSIPETRVLKIIESSEAELLINMDGTEDQLFHTKVNVMDKSQVNKMMKSNQDTIPEDFWVSEEDNFYIIYTSGSTGNPKGVQITLKNLTSFVEWILSDFSINPNQIFLNQAPFSFDLSVMDLYPSLASGGTIFALEKDLVLNPKLMFEKLKKSKLNIWVSTPSFMQICLMEPTFHEGMLPTLQTFMFCGEVLPVQTASELRKRFPNAVIYNTYGPTEATVAVTSIAVTDDLLKNTEALPVGKSKGDTVIEIMDENGEILSELEKGEIIIAGPSVSKGYFLEEDLTKKAFFTYKGLSAFRTGDSGYYRNGLLYCSGRIDFQIKLNGYRMELEEIERHLLQSRYVNATVVVPKRKGDRIEYLMAVIIPEENEFQKEFELTKAIKQEMQESLPSYMIPRAFKYVQSLPLTNNGKIDRKKVSLEVKA
jgi:D-alanine--poly(phosphoribitol) ligase subunit 1